MVDLQNIFTDFMRTNSDAPKSGNCLNERVLIIDGLNTFIRSFLAVPTVNHNGKHVGALVGFLRSLSLAITKFRPTRCIVAFDGLDCAYRRRQIYPAYKSERKNKMRLNRFVPMGLVIGEDKSFEEQLIRLEQYMNCLPITAFMMNHLEADDIIGYMTTTIFKDSPNVTIYSADKDFYQLINNRVQVYSPTKKKLYTESTITEELEILPKNYLTYKALTGDDSDNIKGIKGAGLKTLLKYIPELLTTYLTCSDIINISRSKQSEKKCPKLFKTIVDNEYTLLLNEELMQLHNVNITGVQIMDIHGWVEKEISRYNPFEFKKLYNADGLSTYNDYFLSNLSQAFGQLEYYNLKQ